MLSSVLKSACFLLKMFLFILSLLLLSPFFLSLEIAAASLEFLQVFLLFSHTSPENKTSLFPLSNLMISLFCILAKFSPPVRISLSLFLNFLLLYCCFLVRSGVPYKSLRLKFSPGGDFFYVKMSPAETILRKKLSP